MNWTCFVSQTGSEVVSLSKGLGIVPDLIITNNYKRLSQETLSYIKEKGINVTVLPFNPTYHNYEVLNIPKYSLVTLHGWLRILPKEFCESNIELYNGHPGLITKFPELKGKDPQIRACENQYHLIGSVVHRVIAEVDEGEILTYDEVNINSQNINDYYEELRKTSYNAWLEFLLKYFEHHKSFSKFK